MTRFLKIVGVLLLIAAALVVFHRPLLNAAGRWLVVEDPLQRVDVIVVLAGGAENERVQQAAALYQRGYAPRVLLSGGGETAGIATSELLRRRALRDGVPSSALLFETHSTSTYEQARNLFPQLEQLGVRRAIVVTSAYHSRRTAYLFHKIFRNSSTEISIYPAQHDAFDPEEWWTREHDTERVVLEYVKLAIALFQ